MITAGELESGNAGEPAKLKAKVPRGSRYNQ